MFELHIEIDKGRLAAFAIGAVITGLLLGVTVAFAGHDANTIHACVDARGKIRIVSGSDDCKARETSLDWNKVGPQGLPGVTSFYTRDSSDETVPPSGGPVTATALCDSGDAPTGGGYGLRSGPIDTPPFEVLPDAVGISVKGVNTHNSIALVFFARVICADVTP